MDNFGLKLTILGVLYLLVTSASMALTGRNDLMASFGNRDYFNWTVLIIIGLAMLLALGSRIIYVVINYTVFNNPNYNSNAASITAAITALSYLGVLGFNVIFLGEPLTSKIALGFVFIVAGCFLCMS